MMQITIELPEEIGEQLEKQWGNLPQKILEVFVIEAYRKGILSSGEIQSLLKLSSRWATEKFLQQYDAYPNYNKEDLEQDIKTIENLYRP